MITRTPKKHYSVIVIGSGPAGFTVAKTLADNGHKNILIIESGMYNYDKKQNQLSKIEAKGDLTSSYFQQHNLRMFGGTSSVWGGYCTVMEQLPFDKKIWPIKYNELTAYYQPAAKILELSQLSWKKPFSSIKGTEDLIYKPYYLSPPIRFAKKYTPYIIKNKSISILFGHTVIRIDHKNELAKTLIIVDKNKKLLTISADYYVITGGGINTPHLLQLSGINNPIVTGKYLMEHPHFYNFGRIQLNPDTVNAILHSEKRCIHALQFSDTFCEQNNSLFFNFSLNVNSNSFLSNKDKSIEFGITIRSEMTANSDNAITLSKHLDWSGQPHTKINFNFNYAERLKKAWEQFGNILLKNSLGRASIYSDEYKITGGGHMIGTTRMGHKPESSTVNPNCRVHNLRNLYVAGSSIFPTAGAANLSR